VRMGACRLGLLGLMLVIATGARAQTPQGADPCDAIVSACRQAGFTQGGGSRGTGLWVNCVDPIIQGLASKAARPLPTIAAQLVTDCRTARPGFGGTSPVTYQLGPARVFATNEQLSFYGFQWGPSDGQFGAIPLGGGQYAFYCSAGAKRSCALPANGKTQGTFGFTGTLDSLTGASCQRLFGPGDGPPGWNFTEHYAGGGKVAPFWSGGKRGWLLVFHGEYQWSNPLTPDHWCVAGKGPGSVPCYYSSLGLAVSTDEGRSFKVAGEVYQPSQPLSVFLGGGRNMVVSYGSLVVADANGRHLDNPPPDPTKAYFYLFAMDSLPSLPGVCGRVGCAAVARAPYNDVIQAALSGDPHRVAQVFRKYDASAPDPWTQPATGDSPDQQRGSGRFASIISDGGRGGADVIYDSAFKIHLMVEQVAQGFVVRSSTDLIHWSAPIGPTYHEDGRTVFYPSFLGETGDPTIAGPSPRVYFTSFVEFPKWKEAEFKSVALQLMSLR